jgi:hypothetical protein
MMQMRREPFAIPLVREYVVRGLGLPFRARRGTVLRRIEKTLGTGDAWTLIRLADDAWARGSEEWSDLGY